jgi:hypothetical protein
MTKSARAEHRRRVHSWKRQQLDELLALIVDALTRRQPSLLDLVPRVESRDLSMQERDALLEVLWLELEIDDQGELTDHGKRFDEAISLVMTSTREPR